MKRSAFARACARYPEHVGPRDRELVEASSLTIPGLRLVSEANAHEHHWRRVKRAQQQGADVRLYISATWGVGTGRRLVLPLEVRLVRIAPRSLDQGNREGCFKHVQDEIAAWLGVDDRHEELVRYRYEQERGAAKTYACRIEISCIRVAQTCPNAYDSGGVNGRSQ